jgi:hypothetical protein
LLSFSLSEATGIGASFLSKHSTRSEIIAEID